MAEPAATAQRANTAQAAGQPEETISQKIIGVVKVRRFLLAEDNGYAEYSTLLRVL